MIICPTYDKNKTYHNFANNDKRFFVISPNASNVDEINETLKDITIIFSGTNTLIILDDCAVSKDLKNRSNKFIDLAFSGRLETNQSPHIYNERLLITKYKSQPSKIPVKSTTGMQ